MENNNTETKPETAAQQEAGGDCPSATCSTFAAHKEQTALDLEQFAGMITALAAHVREGNMAAWEAFWVNEGTEDGDAMIFKLRELLFLRYSLRLESIESNDQGHESPPQ